MHIYKRSACDSEAAMDLEASFDVEDLYENTGLLAEYFAPFDLADSCDAVNGSTQVHWTLHCARIIV